MSEQYPLLCDELSEEERFSPRYRQLLTSKARAKNHVKGAAAIIKRWPGQWTTLLHYWWIGIGMLALTTYLLYNCLFSYVMLETTKNSYVRPYDIQNLRLTSPITQSLPPKVFMHLFVEDKQEIDLNNYLPYIDIITKKYKHFKYQLIIVTNDTNLQTKNLGDQENNRLALNSLWYNSDNHRIENSDNNLHIKYTTFSKYFNDSPLEKYWKNVPHQFLKFLVRAVSVWEKGGIAFDPIVLTPQSPNSIYIDKIYRILKKFNVKKAKAPLKQYKLYKKLNKNNKSSKGIPHNIQDVINALENNIGTEKSFQEPLDEAETKDSITITHVRKLRSLADINGTNKNKNVTKPLKLKETQNVHSNNLNHESRPDSSPKFNLLPMFLNYLFHNKESKHPDETTSNFELIKHADADNLLKDIVASNENKTRKDFWGDLADQNNHNPIIINAKVIDEKLDNGSNLADNSEKNVEDSFEVTIDLKGNIIATETVCHAFIGGMFTNAIHHDHSETVTEFIIKELSIFCKGLFSSCLGIDVILL